MSLLHASDCFVIFGAGVRPGGQPSGTLRRRVEGALRLAEASEDPLFLVTGAVGRHPPAEAEVMHRLLTAGGIPEQRILRETTGTDTLSSALASARILRDRVRARRIVVCTSPYHLSRSVLLLRILGVRAVAGAMPPDRPHLPVWQYRRYRLKEFVAGPYDLVLAILYRLIGRI